MILKVTSRIARWGRLLFLPLIGCSRSPLRNDKFLFSFFISIYLLLVPTSNVTALELSSDSETATAGFFQLTWTGTAPRYQLQESVTPGFTSFKTLYHGADLATVISGKPDGEYYYRIVIDDSKQGVQSNVVKVSVVHHSLVHAFLFFIAGAFVFTAILIVIFRGNRQQAA